MTQNLGEKHKEYHMVRVPDFIYQKLQKESDKTGYKIQDILTMYLADIYEQKSRND